MIIVPTTPPVALVDQNSINQAQQNQSQSSEASRKATDTVKISSEAQQLAGSLVNDKPVTIATEPKPISIVADPKPAVAVEAKTPVPDLPKADIPTNGVTQKPEANRIDVLT